MREATDEIIPLRIAGRRCTYIERLRRRGYDLDEPDRLLLTSIDDAVTINMNNDDLTNPIQILVGNKGF